MIANVLTIGKTVMQIIRAHGSQSGKPDMKKACFYKKMASEWDLGGSSKINFSVEDFKENVRKYVESIESVHERNGTKK